MEPFWYNCTLFKMMHVSGQMLVKWHVYYNQFTVEKWTLDGASCRVYQYQCAHDIIGGYFTASTFVEVAFVYGFFIHTKYMYTVQ